MQVFFIFRVLSGNIDFPVNVLFFTSNGSAQGNVSCLCFFHVLFIIFIAFQNSDRYFAYYCNVMLLSVDISDYIGVSMEFSITGTESVSVPVNITNDDVQEGGENFFGNLAAGSGAANFTNIMFNPILATANIADDDGNDNWEGGGMSV